MNAVKGLKILGAVGGVIAGICSATLEGIKIKKLASEDPECDTKKD